GHVTVARQDPDKCAKCASARIEQETDVLDTWFSSALWPFSTLGWPHKTEALKTFYPTSTLVTSFDIIFFWVARMIMMGLKFMGDVPFRDVYIHALVRDAEGQKMSKTKGNVVDPLEIMGKFGSDSLRMTLTAFAAQGRDIKLAEDRIEGYRNFTNKLWNASRFALMNLEGFDFSKTSVDRPDLALADQWILSRLQRATITVRAALDEYRFNEAAGALYQFVWGELCDWYLELIKTRLSGAEPGGDAARHTLAYTVETTLRLLSPIMPYITEELWQRFKPSGDMIVHARYPQARQELLNPEAETDMAAVMEVTQLVRNIRGELGIKPSLSLNVVINAVANPQLGQTLERQLPFINKLAMINARFGAGPGDIPEQRAVGVAQGVEVYVDLSGVSGSDERRAKLEKEIAKVQKEIDLFTKKLGNRKYVESAPAEVVEKDRKKLADYQADAEKLREHLKSAI
ncbi:MAG: class I tRNA ligase family protein, partial [Nitrospinota bacterium]|nr:class I tRNA ligase family protein [Nitrospinota bacterium]